MDQSLQHDKLLLAVAAHTLMNLDGDGAGLSDSLAPRLTVGWRDTSGLVEAYALVRKWVL